MVNGQWSIVIGEFGLRGMRFCWLQVAGWWWRCCEKCRRLLSESGFAGF